MEAIKTRLNAITIILLSVFAILGCSKDDPDYYCDYNFVVTISPEGSGNVSECNRCGPDNEYIILTATPNQGYEFKE